MEEFINGVLFALLLQFVVYYIFLKKFRMKKKICELNCERCVPEQATVSYFLLWYEIF